ncbi:related to RAD4-Excision repair protein (N-terminal fragment) [Sporisorium scitamineum]|uniref:Related to RAD4-Excision repair protein (N-terminal) n=1 Tax=Sporisorium scitamineum TaxID=49012 RepID=A0A0F7S3W4_9BASI|nr:related to RAD4-Excision repair protein (N-terminal fragment) [Sporisorium scitamineum]CDW97041.1 hypothetical protein [Sporisorium scitamineum]
MTAPPPNAAVVGDVAMNDDSDTASDVAGVSVRPDRTSSLVSATARQAARQLPPSRAPPASAIIDLTDDHAAATDTAGNPDITIVSDSSDDPIAFVGFAA